MKNFSNILHRGNLTAREKFLLLIQNDVQKAKTGKEALTPADKDALENWKAQNNEDAREWNKLNDGWKHTGRMELEAELIYKDAQVAYLSQLPIIMKLLYYPGFREIRGSIDTLKRIKKVSLEEATVIGAKQKAVKMRDGLDFEYAVYQLTFERLNPGDRKRMNELYSDIETDHQYLDQEEIIANLYNGKTELSDPAKERLAELIAEQSYNKFAKEYQLFHYFACIPLIEIAKHFLKSKGIEVKGKPLAKNQESDDEDTVTCDDVTKAIEAYAMEHSITVKAMLKAGFLIGLEKGILQEYTPLVVSNDAELLNRWLAAKVEARNILRKHIDTGELALRERTTQESRKDMLYSKCLYDGELEVARKILENIGVEVIGKGEVDEKVAFEPFDGNVITGDSLYGLKTEYQFVKEFKERVDRYEPNLGIVYADDDPEQKGEHLDQELLVCGLNNKNEADFFSLYGMSISKLSILVEGNSFFTDEVEDGKIYLKFKDTGIEAAFKMKRNDLIEGYAKLLAFHDLLKKVERIYETDITYHLADRVKILREYIEQNNQAIRVATNIDKTEKSEYKSFFRKSVLNMKDDLLIDIDTIQPDQKAVEEHAAKLEKILGNLY